MFQSDSLLFYAHHKEPGPKIHNSETVFYMHILELPICMDSLLLQIVLIFSCKLHFSFQFFAYKALE